MDKEQALHAFWSSFEIPAYDENSVPDDTPFPYLTYSVATDSLGNIVPLSINVYYLSSSWQGVTRKSDEIAHRIKGNGYEMLTFDRGYIYLTPGTPFVQRLAVDGDPIIKRAYINVLAEYLCEY